MTKNELPAPCIECVATQGAGKLVDVPNRDGIMVTAVAPCNCARGIEIARRRKLRDAPPPDECPESVLTDQERQLYVEMLAAIPWFPAESGARLAIEDEMACLCRSRAEAEWLVRRMRRLYPHKWPGPAEMRLVYCAKFDMPLDGLLPAGISSVYPDGIPSERQSQPHLVASPQPKELTAGDAQIAAGINYVAKVLLPAPRAEARAALRRDAEFRQTLQDLETDYLDRKKWVEPKPIALPGVDADGRPIADAPPQPLPPGSYKPITQADIDATLAAMRRAKKEAS